MAAMRTQWRFKESHDGRTIYGGGEVDMDRLCENWEILTGYCESPIEFTLACELYHRFTIAEQRIPYIIRPDGHGLPKLGYTFEPQRRFGPYKADFAITFLEPEKDPGGSGIYTYDDMPHCYCARLVVECDGHDFHDRTKEQAARDKKRDRILLTNGWPVARFTGSEIHADVGRCAEQVIQILHAMVEQEAHATEHMRLSARLRREAEANRWGR
jgi:hypothetical protein